MASIGLPTLSFLQGYCFPGGRGHPGCLSRIFQRLPPTSTSSSPITTTITSTRKVPRPAREYTHLRASGVEGFRQNLGQAPSDRNGLVAGCRLRGFGQELVSLPVQHWSRKTGAAVEQHPMGEFPADNACRNQGILRCRQRIFRRLQRDRTGGTQESTTP